MVTNLNTGPREEKHEVHSIGVGWCGLRWKASRSLGIFHGQCREMIFFRVFLGLLEDHLVNFGPDLIRGQTTKPNLILGERPFEEHVKCYSVEHLL